MANGDWQFTPQQVREVESKLRDSTGETIKDVSIGVRSAVASNADEAFIVTPEYAEENNLEKELLRPIVRGEDTRRWTAEWAGELAIYPYNEELDHISVEEYPEIKSHLDEYSDLLESRYCVKKGSKSIYEYDGPRPRSVFEGDFKIAVPDMASENHFLILTGTTVSKILCTL